MGLAVAREMPVMGAMDTLRGEMPLPEIRGSVRMRLRPGRARPGQNRPRVVRGGHAAGGIQG